MKTILQIIGIATLFSIVGFGITYPYELSYSGTDSIKLIKNSYEFNSLSEIIERDEFKNKVLYIDLSEPFDISFKNEMELKYSHFPKLIDTYQNKDIEFIYLTRPDSESGLKQDNIRKWIFGIKKYKLRGHHAVMSPVFYKGICNDIPEIEKAHYLPHYLIVDKNEIIVNLNAPAPYEFEKLYPELNQLLN